MNHLRRLVVCHSWSLSCAMRWSLGAVLCAVWSVTASAQDAEPAKAAVPSTVLAHSGLSRSLKSDFFNQFKQADRLSTR